jgi:hypothetical protein
LRHIYSAYDCFVLLGIKIKIILVANATIKFLMKLKKSI